MQSDCCSRCGLMKIPAGERKVYAYHEDFEPYFSRIRQDDPRFEQVVEKDLQEHGLGKESLGQIKFSFANLLMLHRPLVILDGLHNARTSLTFDTLKRVHLSCSRHLIPIKHPPLMCCIVVRRRN
jgi:hypothetical protein